MENIETQTTRQINFDKKEVRSTGSKNLKKYAIYGVWSEHNICFGAFLTHTNSFGAGRKKLKNYNLGVFNFHFVVITTTG